MDYAAAGELFGHLRKALGFGELTMTTRTWGQAKPPNAVVYEWEFDQNGRVYQLAEVVSSEMLFNAWGIEAFARQLAAKWKRQWWQYTKDTNK